MVDVAKVRRKMDEGLLEAEDLEDPETLAVVESYLQEKYPNLDLGEDIGEKLLQDPEVLAKIEEFASKKSA